MSADDDYIVPHETLLRLGRGDAKAGRRLLRVLIDVEAVREQPAGRAHRPASIRIATEADEPNLLELLEIDHQENASVVAPFDRQHVQSWIQAGTRERDATIGVIDGPSSVIGVIYLVPEIWWFSSSWYIAERLLFVHPHHRKSRHARDLLQFAQSFVDDMSERLGYRVFLISSVVGTTDVDKKAALWGRMMTRGGGIFIYPPPA